jgi:O-antigen/teichoic acid export membrane protein
VKACGEIYLPKMQLLATLLAALFALLTGFAVLWSGPVIAWLYPDGYAPAAELVPLIIFTAGLTVLSRLGVATAMIAHTPKYHTVIYWSAFLINIVIGFLLIPAFGIKGAMIGTITAEAYILACWIYLGRFKLKNLPIRWGIPIATLLMTLLFMVIMRNVMITSFFALFLLSGLVISSIAGLLLLFIGREGIKDLMVYIRT